MGELGTLTRVGEELLVSILQLIPPSSLSLVTRSSRALRTVGSNEACWTGHVPEAWISAGVNTTRGAGLLRAVEVKEAVCSNSPRIWDKVSDPLHSALRVTVRGGRRGEGLGFRVSSG